MRALVLRLSSLGDVVLTEPLVRTLSAHGYAVHFVTDARYAHLLRRGFSLERVIAYDRHGADRGAAGIRRVRDRIGSDSYDVVVDLQGKLRTRWLANRIRARKRFTLVKRTPFRAALALIGRDAPLSDRHATQMYLDVLAPLGLTGSDPAPRLPRAASSERMARFVIALGPGARHATKRWPAEHFLCLADRVVCIRPDAEILLVGGPDERDLFEKMRAERPNFRWSGVDLTRQSVDTLAHHVALARLYVGADSGPAHVAAASGVPTVVLFGPTAPERWGPLGREHQVVRLDLDCAPCSNIGGHRCPRSDRTHACLTDLSVDRVFRAVRPLLGTCE